MFCFFMTTSAKTYEIAKAIRFFIVAALSKGLNVMHVKRPLEPCFRNAAMLANVTITTPCLAPLGVPVRAIVLTLVTALKQGMRFTCRCVGFEPFLPTIKTAKPTVRSRGGCCEYVPALFTHGFVGSRFPTGYVGNGVLSCTFTTAIFAGKACIPFKLFTAFGAMAFAFRIRAFQLAIALTGASDSGIRFPASEGFVANRALSMKSILGIALALRATFSRTIFAPSAVCSVVGKFFAARLAASSSIFRLLGVTHFLSLALSAISVQARSGSSVFVELFERFPLLAFTASLVRIGTWIQKKKPPVGVDRMLVEGTQSPTEGRNNDSSLSFHGQQLCTLDAYYYTTFGGI